MAGVQLDDVAITALLTDEHDMVGRFLADLADQVATVARGAAPVRKAPPWSSRSDTRPRGFLKASITTAMGHYSSTGNLWASANAPADPASFLENPRVDRTKEPFLTVGLWSLAGLL